MIGSTRALRVFAFAAPCDLRRSFNGLYAMVVEQLRRDPIDGDSYFLFVNRTRTSCKILHHDGTGLCIYHKRLDTGRFAPLWRSNSSQAAAIELTHSELALFIEGCTEVGYRSLSPSITTQRNVA